MNLAGLTQPATRRACAPSPVATLSVPDFLIERTTAAAPKPILRQATGVNGVPGREGFIAPKVGNAVFHEGRCAR